MATKQVPGDLTVSFGYKVSHARRRIRATLDPLFPPASETPILLISVRVDGKLNKWTMIIIINNRATIFEEDSLTIHVPINNLQRDNIEQVGLKLKRLSTTIKTHTKDTLEVAIPSIINRKDNHTLKVMQINEIICKICNDNRWTYINNKIISQSQTSAATTSTQMIEDSVF